MGLFFVRSWQGIMLEAAELEAGFSFSKSAPLQGKGVVNLYIYILYKYIYIKHTPSLSLYIYIGILLLIYKI